MTQKMTNTERVAELNRFATPGKWCQFHPTYTPEAKGKPWSELDTSHQSSAVRIDDVGELRHKRISEWKHANDAAFAEALVNLYREGKITVID